MELLEADLVAPARVAISITVVACVVSFLRAFPRDGAARPFFRVALGWSLVMGAVALVVTHAGLVDVPGRYLPLGVAPGLVLAILSLGWGPARAAFDALPDHQVRHLMLYRAVFGAFLFAGAGLGLFPPVFAWTAGLGDLLAGWLAIVAPRVVPDGGRRAWPLVVHGWGALDLVDVAVLGTLVVRPWLVAHHSPGPSMALPWVAVPLLFALNLHGIRRALGARAVRGSPDARRERG